MSKSFGLRLKDDVMSCVDELASKLNINKSKVVLLLIDVALSTNTIDMIMNHYYHVHDRLFKHGNTKS